MSFWRMTTRIILIISFLICIGLIVFAIITFGVNSENTWILLAATLAVITSIISSISSQKILELEEDAQEPNLLPSFDITSRYGLIQFRVSNFGGTPAHDISFHWDVPLLKNDDTPVRFSETSPEIATLLPGESASLALGASHEFFRARAETTYSGVINFKNSSSAKRELKFTVSAEHHRQRLTFDNEELATHYELQKIPDQLKDIAGQIKLLRDDLSKK